MRNFKRFTAIVLTIALTLSVFYTSTFAADTQTQGNNINADYLESVKELIEQNYSGSITEEDLNKPTVKEMFDSLDDYSTFFSPEEYSSFYSSLEGSVEGVGISVHQIDKYLTIMKVFAGSPAKKAGILSGDKIVEVNGESVAGQQIEDVVGKVKGLAGTTVKLGISRQGVKDIITFKMERAQVTIPSVSYEIRGDIGYILIDSFAANAYSGVAEALKIFDSKKITNVVLDLRNNPGGYVDQAIQVAKSFVPKGLITKLDYKNEAFKDEAYYSALVKTKYKLAVLVNENSASASEILTGAIKDTKAGIVIGTKTYGKAKVQSSFPILSPEAYERLNKDKENKSVNVSDFYFALQSDILGWGKMTIGLYYTPSGECIDLKGIEPNVKVQNTSPSGIQVNLVEPMTATVKPGLGTQYVDVFNTECILKLLKYDVGTPDFTLDKKTFAAIKKFQKNSKVYSYGVLDFTTQKLLNKQLDKLKQTQDKVYAKAVELLK
jgi:carboxyl-terminal processing protease